MQKKFKKRFIYSAGVILILAAFFAGNFGFFDAEATDDALKTSPCGSYGDVNGDGYVTNDDSTWILESLVGTRTLTDAQKKNGDVNDSGSPDTGDATLIQRYAAGLDATFTVCSKSIQVLSPNGGEQWANGKAQQITWSMTGIDKVKITLLWNESDESPSSEEIATVDYSSPVDSLGNPYVRPADNKYYYSWYIPLTQTLRSTYRIQISDASKQYATQSGTEYDVSDNYFSISSQTIKVVSPNGGESFTAGKDIEVSFINSLTKNTDITITNCSDNSDLCNGNNYGGAWVTGSADNVVQKTSINIPLSAAAGKYKVVASAQDLSSPVLTAGSDKSDNFFDIVKSTEGAIAVTSPVKDSSYAVGNPIKINWTMSGAVGPSTPVKIWLLKGYDTPLLIKDGNVALSVPNQYVWTIPSTFVPDLYNSYTIKVGSVNNSYIFGNSGAFKITKPSSWDVSIRFDKATNGYFYPFSDTAGTIGTTLYKNLSETDNLYTDTPFNDTCPAGWPYYNERRAKGWFAERKMITDTKYKLLIRGISPADCGGEIGYVKGELNLNSDTDWQITEATKCYAQTSNKGQTTYCETGEKNIKFAAGNSCGGCCACADSGNIDIEVIVEKNNTPSPEPVPTPAPASACLPDGSLVKIPDDPKIYVIKNCQKYWIQSLAEFERDGYRWESVQEVASATVNALPETTVAPIISQDPLTAGIVEGALIQADGEFDIYIVKYTGSKKFKRLILNPSVFNNYAHLKWGNIKKVSKTTVDAFTDSTLVRSVSTGKIYKLIAQGDDGEKRPIESLSRVTGLGYDPDSIYEINGYDESSYATGAGM